MRLRLAELQESDEKSRKIRAKRLKDSYKAANGILHHQELLFVPKIMWTEFISRHHNDFFEEYFDIDKTGEFIYRKSYWLSLRKDIKTYVKGCDVCWLSKTVSHKSYDNLEALPVLIH